jgi:hypothetical protein
MIDRFCSLGFRTTFRTILTEIRKIIVYLDSVESENIRKHMSIAIFIDLR